MSFQGDGGNNNSGFRADRGSGFDRTTGPGNRDAWNNPIREPQRRDNNGNGDGNGGDNNGDNGNNNGINDDLIATIWDNVDNQNKGGKGGNNNSDNNGGGNNGGGGNNNNPTPPDPEKQMANYLKSQGLEFTAPNFTDDEKTAMQSGDFTPLARVMHQTAVQAHIKALSGASTMIEAAIEKAVTKATQASQSAILGEMNKKALESKLPWTKEKGIGPMAQAVMQRFLSRGLSTEDAIIATDKYFDAIQNKRGAGNVNKNRSAGFGSEVRSDAPEGGWLNVLAPRQ